MTNIIGKSLHISWTELACKDSTPYPASFICDGRIIELVVMFERIRSLYNLPIIINSAYRTESWNKKVGGSPKSQHLEGKALDLRPPASITVEKFYSDIKNNANEFGVKGLGKYSIFVHVDIRNSQELITW